MPRGIGSYDMLLLLAVSAQVAVIAYVHEPKWKAVLFTLPIPFTFSSLALGHPIDATNVLGIPLVLLFLQGVRTGHERYGAPIVPSIAACALGYSMAGWALAGIVPSGGPAFWLSGCAVLVITLIVGRARHSGIEKRHRTSLPVWIKLPIVMALVLVLVLIKQHLRGFMTMFPLVSIFAAYETRHSLWTLSRQAPIMMLAMLAMMMVSRLTHETIGLAGSLALGWIAFLGVLIPITRPVWASTRTTS